MEIALISETLFKQYGPIKDDTFVSKFVPYILLAQKMYVEKILGRKLADQLQAQIAEVPAWEEIPDNPAPYPVTPESQALLLYVAPVLAHYAVYQGLPFHWAALVNKGVTLRNSENSDAVTLKDLAQLRRWLKDDAEEWGRQLLAYLCECASSYPLWSPNGRCGDGCGKSKLDPLDAGIWIPKRKRGCC